MEEWTAEKWKTTREKKTWGVVLIVCHDNGG